MLHQLFCHKPSLVEQSIPHRWREITHKQAVVTPWDLEELRATLRSVLRQRDTRCVFFIDGLDEFEADHLLIIEDLQYISRQPTAKVCVSSRTVSTFHAAFGHSSDSRWVLQRLPSFRVGLSGSASMIHEDGTAHKEDDDAQPEPENSGENAEEEEQDEEEEETDEAEKAQALIRCPRRTRRPNATQSSQAQQTDDDMIDLTTNPDDPAYLVKRFKQEIPRSEVFSRLRRNNADIFDKYSLQCVSHEEPTDRLGEVAATIRSSGLAHILRRQAAWSVVLRTIEALIKAEYQQALRFQRHVRRPEGKASLCGLVATTAARVRIIETAKDRHDRIVAELRDWAAEVERAEKADDME